MTKQEIIQKAYEAVGVDWETKKSFVNMEDGFAATLYDTNEISGIDYLQLGLKDIDIKNSVDTDFGNAVIWRLKSLYGIENNNGWIKIESEEDLPDQDCDVWMIFKDEISQASYNTERKIFEDSTGWYGYKTISHYQKIEKPKLPIY